MKPFWRALFRRWSRGGVTDFHGVRFGTSRAEAIALLTAHARSLGEAVVPSEHGDEVGCGGSVYLTGEVWTLGFDHDDWDRVCSHVGMWRGRPAGREASLVWVAGRVAAYGPPDCMALLAPTASRPVAVGLEWSGDGGVTTVALHASDGEWDVREDRHAHAWAREGHVGLREHREQLRRLGERLARRCARTGSLGELLDRMETWVREREGMLAALSELVPGVRVVDVAGAAAQAMRMLDAIDRGFADSDGAFLVVRAPVEPQLTDLRQRLWGLAQGTGLRAQQLTWRPGLDHEPETGEPLPPAPDEQIDWLEGPLAAGLLREDLLPVAAPALKCVVVPAKFVVVDGATEAWLHVPPAGGSPWSRKYAILTQALRPLRLTDPRSGVSVYLNLGGSQEDLRRYAHALLAALLEQRA